MLSTRCRYALHALVHLAGNKTGIPIRISEIADTNRLPRKFLEGILSDLKKGGILSSKRGQQGGYLLARPAHDIRLNEVIRLLDGPQLLAPCSHDTACDECADRGFCHLRSSFKAVDRATESKLEGTRLSTLLRSKTTVKAKRKKQTTAPRRSPRK